MPRVLVVDDERLYRTLLTKAISAHGYEAEAVGGVQSALATARRRPPDVLVADFMLRDSVTGLDLARELREQIPDLAVILITGLSATDLPSGKGAVEIFELLEKPFTHEALLSALHRATGALGAVAEPKRQLGPA